MYDVYVGALCRGACVEDRGQLCGVSSLFSPSCTFWALNSASQIRVANAFSHWASCRSIQLVLIGHERNLLNLHPWMIQVSLAELIPFLRNAVFPGLVYKTTFHYCITPFPVKWLKLFSPLMLGAQRSSETFYRKVEKLCPFIEVLVRIWRGLHAALTKSSPRACCAGWVCYGALAWGHIVENSPAEWPWGWGLPAPWLQRMWALALSPTGLQKS